MCDATQMNCLGAVDKQKALQTPNCSPMVPVGFSNISYPYYTKATDYFSDLAMGSSAVCQYFLKLQ